MQIKTREYQVWCRQISQARCHILWLRDETKFCMKHNIYHIKILSLNVNIYVEYFRSSVYGGKNIQKVYNVTTRPTCLVLIMMILTSLDVARHFLCAIGTKCDYQNSKSHLLGRVESWLYSPLTVMASFVIDAHFSFVRNSLLIEMFLSPLVTVSSDT